MKAPGERLAGPRRACDGWGIWARRPSVASGERPVICRGDGLYLQPLLTPLRRPEKYFRSFWTFGIATAAMYGWFGWLAA